MMNKLEKITLRRGDWEAVILPAYSANTLVLRCGGEDIMRTPENDDEFIASHIVYGSAFLLPPDRTVGGKFVFDGKEYSLPINDSRGLSNLHGLMHDAAFEVRMLKEDEAELFYENCGERYPFPFTVTVSCRLTVESYTVSYTFRNTGDTAMPLLFGLHANFSDPGYAKVPLMREMPMNMTTLVPEEREEPLSDAAARIARGTDTRGLTVSGFFTSAGNRAEIGAYSYTVSENFTHWVLWNGSGEDGFISIEPQNGPVNSLITGGYPVLDKNETITYTTDIRRKDQ